MFGGRLSSIYGEVSEQVRDEILGLTLEAREVKLSVGSTFSLNWPFCDSKRSNMAPRRSVPNPDGFW